MSVEFIVLGLPRSGTTWLANWLTTDQSLCLHDPFAGGLPETWNAGGKRLGISCTGAYLMPSWLKAQTCPVAVIEREPAACDASLERLGLTDTSLLLPAFRAVAGRRWRFEDIWNETTAREMWAFLLPGIAFDAPRYRLLCEMQVQPHMGKWSPDTGVMKTLRGKGYFDGHGGLNDAVGRSNRRNRRLLGEQGKKQGR